jgi:hypothetical protein
VRIVTHFRPFLLPVNGFDRHIDIANPRLFEHRLDAVQQMFPLPLLQRLGGFLFESPAHGVLAQHPTHPQALGIVQAGIPLLRGGVNAPAKLEDIGMGAVGGGDLLQLLVGLDVIAQSNPALGGL